MGTRCAIDPMPALTPELGEWLKLLVQPALILAGVGLYVNLLNKRIDDLNKRIDDLRDDMKEIGKDVKALLLQQAATKA